MSVRRHLRVWGPDVERDLDDELRFHFEMRVAEYTARGMSPEQARAEALRQFGDVGEVRAACRALDRRRERSARLAERLESAWQDVRYAARSLRRTPGFTVAAAITLALGIGATTAVYSVVDGVLLRPLPYPEPERVVHLWETSVRTGADRNPVSIPNYRDFVARQRSFSAIGAYSYNRYTLGAAGAGGAPEQVQGSQFYGDVFRVTGVRPLLGRTLGPADDRANVVVLSERLWRGRYGGDSGVVGRAIRMNGEPWTVVGVMPDGFRFPRPDVELWASYATILQYGDSAFGRGRRFQRVVARLAPGVALERAAADVGAIGRWLAEEYPDANGGGGAVVVPLHEQLVGGARPALLVLLGAVVFVLLIACANVAHLLLARTAARERELAVRVALGAGRGRLVQQLLLESLALATLGGVLGVLLAYWGVDALVHVNPRAVPRLEAVAVDPRVLAVSLGVVTLTGLLVGVAPALRGTRLGLAAAAREGTRGSGTSGRRHRSLGALVTAEVALSLVLLVGAGLMLRSFARLTAVDPGLDPRGVTTMLVAASPTEYRTPERQRLLFGQVLERVGALPGVEAVGLCDCLPPDEVRTHTTFSAEGVREADALPITEQTRVAGDYFRVLGVPLVAGRLFAAADRADAPPVAVVNATLARRVYGSPAAAVGRRVSFDGGAHWSTIVGVVGDVRYDGLGAPVDPAIYSPFAQDPFPGMYMFVRASAGARDPMAAIPAVRRAVLEIDAELPLADVASLESRLAASVTSPRFNTLLLALFAGLAFALAAVGIYGVVSYGVAQRTHEIGVRIALGARRGHVLRLVLGRGVRPALAGVAIGLVGATLAAGVLARLLYGTSPHDPLTYGLVAVLLVGVALVASYVPARRAMAIEPATALRSE